MPLIDYDTNSNIMDMIGFRKIWDNHQDESYDYNKLMISVGYKRMDLRMKNFIFQMLNCCMICIIALQS